VTKLQSRLIQTLGDGAVAFTLNFPVLAPNSVNICSDEKEDPSKRTVGVFYDIKVHLAEHAEDYTGMKGSTVSMGIRKVSYEPYNMMERSPTSTAEKGFTFGSGRLLLEASLAKEVYYHGEELPIQVAINNQSKKSIKSIQCLVNQHCELTMVNTQYSCKVARLESLDGCPLQPGLSLKRTYILKPLSQSCAGMRGLCLDASLSKVTDESNLASSSLSESDNVNDLLGVVVSYSVKVKVVLSGMGGELETELPFKLVHPRPESLEMNQLTTEKKSAREKRELKQKRNKFRGQDSVLNESFNTSQDEQHGTTEQK